MIKQIIWVATVTVSISLAQVAVGEPRSTPRQAQPIAPQSVELEPDYACYFRSSDGRVRDLSRLCNRQKKPTTIQANTADRVKLCYAPDGEYFPCPDEGTQ
jgi:hypothetical protein